MFLVNKYFYHRVQKRCIGLVLVFYQNDIVARSSWLWQNHSVTGTFWTTFPFCKGLDLRIKYISLLKKKPSYSVSEITGVVFILQVGGEVSYNGCLLSEFIPVKTSSYISQNDLHIPEMSVRETLDFSACCQGIGSRMGEDQISYTF